MQIYSVLKKVQADCFAISTCSFYCFYFIGRTSDYFKIWIYICIFEIQGSCQFSYKKPTLLYWESNSFLEWNNKKHEKCLLRHTILSPCICHNFINLNLPNIDDFVLPGFGFNLNVIETAKNSGDVNENFSSMTWSFKFFTMLLAKRNKPKPFYHYNKKKI